MKLSKVTKICIRADASPSIGYGHFIRSLALADMLKDNFVVIFYTSEPTEYQQKEMAGVCNYKSLKEESKFSDFLADLNGDEIVVLDNYYYTTEYQQEIKNKGCKLVCIDDPHNIHYVCDILISHGFCRISDFDYEPYTKIVTGPQWALLRNPFLKEIDWNHKRNNDIVINFGGSDPFHDTEKIVGYLIEMQLQYHIIVILGDTVYLSEEKRKKVETFHNLNAYQMASLFENSAFGIFTASTVCIEGMSRGLPMVVGYDIDNQIQGYKLMKKQRIISPIDNLLTVTKTQIADSINKLSFLEKYKMRPENIAARYINLFETICQK